MGIAPFRNDITMIIPYSMMDRAQLDFLDDLAERASFVPVSSTVHRDPVRAMGIGNEVMVITMIDSAKIWSDVSKDGIPLSHKHVSCPLGKAVMSSGDKERIARAKEEASRAVKGSPVAGGSYWQLDTLDVLKAFVACVFRSNQFKVSCHK